MCCTAPPPSSWTPVHRGNAPAPRRRAGPGHVLPGGRDRRRGGGYAYATPYRPRPAYRHTVEDSVYVKTGHGGLGIGGKLLATLVGAAPRPAGARCWPWWATAATRPRWRCTPARLPSRGHAAVGRTQAWRMARHGADAARALVTATPRRRAGREPARDAAGDLPVAAPVRPPVGARHRLPGPVPADRLGRHLHLIGALGLAITAGLGWNSAVVYGGFGRHRDHGAGLAHRRLGGGSMGRPPRDAGRRGVVGARLRGAGLGPCTAALLPGLGRARRGHAPELRTTRPSPRWPAPPGPPPAGPCRRSPCSAGWRPP